jgi:hypothetical protein
MEVRKRPRTGLEGDSKAIRALREARWLLGGTRCPICRKARDKRALDHSHSTGVVRTALCNPCNGALGCVEKGDDAGAERMRKRWGGLPPNWLANAKAYLGAWQRRCEVLGEVLDKHGAADAEPEALIPEALHREGLAAVVMLSTEHPARGQAPEQWQRLWEAEWKKMTILAGANGVTWRIGTIALSMLMLALQWGAEMRMVDPREADELDAIYHPPELRERVRGLPLVAVNFGSKPTAIPSR